MKTADILKIWREISQGDSNDSDSHKFFGAGQQIQSPRIGVLWPLPFPPEASPPSTPPARARWRNRAAAQLDNQTRRARRGQAVNRQKQAQQQLIGRRIERATSHNFTLARREHNMA